MGEPATFSPLNWTVLGLYLAAMVVIGTVLAGKQRTTEDYFLAGRKMPWLAVALSMFASLTSAISYMGVPGTAFRENIALMGVGVASVLVAPILILLFFPLYRRLHVTTSYEYIYARYGRPARFAVAALFLLGRLGWLGTVIYAPALAITVVTGIDMWLAILLMGVLATLYTVLGGLAAVIWTDVAQFIVLVGAAIWVGVSLVIRVPGGAGGIFAYANEQGHLGIHVLGISAYEMTGLVVVFSFIFQLLHDYGTDQVSVQRLMAVKSLSGMAKAAFLNSFFDLSMMGVLSFIGLGLFAYYNGPGGALPESITADKALPYYMIHALPDGVSGLAIAGIFAAAMSSMDSGINSLSTVVMNDFVKPLRRKPRSEGQDVMSARLLTLAVGGFATGVAFIAARIEHILKASTTFLGLCAGPILALFLLGALTRRGHFWGWLAGLPVALFVTSVLEFKTDIHWVYYFPTSTLVSLLAAYMGSLLIAEPPADPEYTVLAVLRDRRARAAEKESAGPDDC
jgi:SSS family solute:Na+ symporter